MNNSIIEYGRKMSRLIQLSLCAFALSGCAYTNNVPRETAQPTPTRTLAPVVNTPKPTVSPPKPTPRKSSTTSAPYVGMYVPSRPAGWAWQGTDNTSVKDKSGNTVKTNKYRYDTDNNSYTIWVDKKDTVVKVNATRDGTASPGPRPSKKPVSTPNLGGFSDPEDFYYWYYDDFYDFEEAEDWYYAHGGK